MNISFKKMNEIEYINMNSDLDSDNEFDEINKLKNIKNAFLDDSDDDKEREHRDVEIIEDDDEKVEIKRDVKKKKDKKKRKESKQKHKKGSDHKFNMSKKEVLTLFNDLKKKWIYDNYESLTLGELVELYKKSLGLKDTYDNDDLDNSIVSALNEIQHIKCCMIKAKLMDESDIEDTNNISIVNIIGVVMYSNNILSCCMHSRRMMNPTYDNGINSDESLNKYDTPDMKNYDEYSTLLHYMYNRLSIGNYKRYKGYVCQEKYIDGKASHYWEKKMEIKKFIEKQTPQVGKTDMWLIRNKANYFNKLIDHLTNNDCEEYFPDLIITSGVYTYNNGVYNSRHVDDKGVITYKFYKYGEKIPSNLISVKYFDYDFTADQYTSNGFHTWRDIPTPYYDKITKFQFDSRVCGNDANEVYDMLLILIGRLICPIKQYKLKNNEDRKFDNWQLCIYIAGLAGTGKSVILDNVINEFFEEIDIGVMENQNEGKFAWYPFKDSKIIVVNEADSTFNTPSSLVKKMISCERLTLPVKGKEVIKMTWTAPIIFVGNEFFKMSDKGGALTRRVMLFNFFNKVNKDNIISNLGELLKSEISNILHKSTCAYLEKLDRLKTKNIGFEKDLCKFFIEQKENVQNKIDPFMNFMTSSRIEIGADYYCDLLELKLIYHRFCKETGYDFDWSEYTYLNAFATITANSGVNLYMKKSKAKKVNEDGNMIEENREIEYFFGFKMVD